MIGLSPSPIYMAFDKMDWRTAINLFLEDRQIALISFRLHFILYFLLSLALKQDSLMTKKLFRDVSLSYTCSTYGADFIQT